MKATFPIFSTSWVALKTLLGKYGVECVVPPPTSQRTLSLGVQHSPEWVCLPHKIILGNLIEGLEQGADTIIHVGGTGLCRLGWYARLHEDALRAMGFEFKVAIFDWQEQQILGLAKFVKEFLGTNKSWRGIIGDIKFGLQQLILMDGLERRTHYIRPRELTPGAASRIWQSAGERVAAAWSPQALKQARQELFAEFDAIPLNPEANPIKVAFLGEFFLVVDAFSNLDLEEELGKRGVEVVRHAYLMNWAKSWLFLEAVGLSHGQKVKRAASRYLRRDVSGDAVQSLGETILHQKEGFDGIIHIQPLTCMPEIIAQNIMPQVTRDHEIPVLGLILDEQMGKAGMLTRLEAFVDLLERRRQRLTVRG